jgi:hypothetical protein
MSIKQLRYKDNNERGQAMVFVVIVLITLLIFVASVVNVGREISYKMEMQNTADSASIAGAVWEARGLNLIAGLNQGIVLSVELIVIIVSAIAILGVCSATLWWAGIGEACATALPVVLNFANNAIRRLWNTAVEMSNLEKKIARIFPYIVPAAVELASGANPNSPVSIPYPYQPSDSVPPPLTPQAISLNVEKGNFQDLISAIMKEISKAIDKIFPLLSQALGLLGKAIDPSALSSNGSISTTFNDSHSYDNYPQAVGANTKAHEPAGSTSGVTSTKSVRADWFYITTDYNNPDPCNSCSATMKKQSSCNQILWTKDDAPPEKISSHFVNCVVENCGNSSGGRAGSAVSVPLKEQDFCKLDLSVKTTTKTSPPSQLPFPMKLHPRAEEFLYIAVATTDLGKKKTPVFISNKSLLTEDKNSWGFVALSQAKPQSPSTKPGDTLLEMDWDAHLTRFTALKAIAQQLGLKSTNNIMKYIDDKLILH